MLPNNCFLYTKDQIINLKTSKLFGYAWTEDSLIFGSKGLNEYLSISDTLPTEGRFCGIFFHKGKILIYSDFTAQETLYVAQKGDDWAVSNSFLLLAQTVARNYSLSFYAPASVGFHLKDGVHIGEQLISHKTMIEEIKVLPITDRIEVDLENGNMKIIKSDYVSILNRKKMDYESLVLDFLERGSGVLQALIEIGVPLNLFLSGGYDSRIILGMLSKTSSYRDLVRIYSHEFKKDDFKSAQMLTNFFGLNMNPPRSSIQGKRISSSDTIRMYMFSCGGVYLPFYPVSHFSLGEDINVRLTGDQPVGRSHFEGSAVFNGSMKKVSQDILSFLSSQERPYAEEVRDDFKTTFEDLGLDIEHPLAQLGYYQSIRSRFHCGRNWYKSLGDTFLFTPLMQHSILLIDEFANTSIHPNKMFADIFSAIGSWALNLPFENGSRNFCKELLDASPFRNGVDIKPRNIKVYGDIFNIENIKNDSLDLLFLDINFNYNDDNIKDELGKIFYQCRYVKNSNVFNKNDFNFANQEIRKRGSLSHNYRKLTHIISTDIVLNIISKSNNLH